MKECPVCKTFVFDDMGVCYGCMHRFSGDGAASLLQSLLPEIAIEEAGEIGENRGDDMLEERGVAGSPESDGVVDAGDADSPPLERWILRVEMRDPREPNRSWAMELAPQPKID